MAETLDEWKRRAREEILNDESLTDELNDDEADALIRWGLAQLEAVAAQLGLSAAPAPVEATNPGNLDDRAYTVRQIMRSVNRLAARRADLTPDELSARLSRLAALGAQLKGGLPPQDMQPVASAPSPEAAPILSFLRAATSVRDALNLLLQPISLTPHQPPEGPPDEPTDHPN